MRCNGKKQEDDGSWYCPRDPHNLEFDCEDCELELLRYYELLEDAKRDEDESRWP